ncbi:RibD family protein [uncultured Chloroflexus sp.]|uniref:RibD family protein n=1 Tax=uncultured Chloroflexus sp. TaxID=214040 RepID=UPI0026160AF5|nr:RibD family protein [uncultured Chloroflexus sp.]
MISPFTLLFEEEPNHGPGLPPELRAIYSGDWRLPTIPAHRPAVWTNFVISHDGRIAFNQPGWNSGNAISRNSRHDHWLMELVRARADAILVGAATLRAARRHRWEAGELVDWPAFAALRASEERPLLPALVILSATGVLPATAALALPRSLFLITTSHGAERALATHPQLTCLVGADNHIDLPAAFATLRQRYGIRTLLSEGGGRTYGTLLFTQLIDEVFLTLSPIIVGNPSPPAPPRPGLVEGVGFAPQHPPRLRLISLRRTGDMLFQRAQLHFATVTETV